MTATRITPRHATRFTTQFSCAFISVNRLIGRMTESQTLTEPEHLLEAKHQSRGAGEPVIKTARILTIKTNSIGEDA